MKVVKTKSGEEARIRKIAIEFTANNESGIAGITVSFDNPIAGQLHRHYLPGTNMFEKVFRKVRFRKLLTEYAEKEFPCCKLSDPQPTEEWKAFKEKIERLNENEKENVQGEDT